VEDFITIDGGRTTVTRDGEDFGTFDNIVYSNTDDPKREYQALQFMTEIPLTTRWNVFGHWTYQIRNHGTFEGEDTNLPQTQSNFGDYPELFSAERSYPDGRLAQFQQHKVVVYSDYTQHLGKLGDVTGGLTWRYESPLVYSHLVTNFPLTPQQLARDPGYASLPQDQTIFFGPRGANLFKGYQFINFALNYAVPVWKTARPWVKLDVRNVLNNDKQIAWNRGIVPAKGSPVDSLGLPTTFDKGPRYGTATSNAHYPDPRQFRIAFGFRF
jgi:hypothetical protein